MNIEFIFFCTEIILCQYLLSKNKSGKENYIIFDSIKLSSRCMQNVSIQAEMETKTIQNNEMSVLEQRNCISSSVSTSAQRVQHLHRIRTAVSGTLGSMSLAVAFVFHDWIIFDIYLVFSTWKQWTNANMTTATSNKSNKKASSWHS